VVHAVRGVTNLPLDVHLMIENPEQYVPEFARAGADALVVHVEATTDLHRVLNQIHDLGIRAGVSLNPATPATEIEEMLDDVDLTLAMTVNPGFGGQTFIEATLSKLALLREMLDATGNEVDLHVDGGIEPQTACRAVAAGATVLVAGEAIFGAKEGIAKSIEALREGARRGMCLRNGG
jgi:ribulose-phosphate 3-epimerase